MTFYDHTAFQVSNIDDSIQFYVNKLGFTLVSHAVDDQEQEAYAFLSIGDLRLELIQDMKDSAFTKPRVHPPYCPHLAIKTSDMPQTVAGLKEAGVTIVRGPLEIVGEETWVYFCDPDNNILEYIQWYQKS
jgi:catechol 2,3-dioxygenase-like lactoylglutathione lyase family enzyme